MDNPGDHRPTKEVPYLNDKKQLLLTTLASLCLVIPLYCRCLFSDLDLRVIAFHFLNVFWISYCTLQIVQGVTRFLDKHYLWEDQFSKRMLLQLLTGVLLPLVFAFGTVRLLVVFLNLRIGIVVSGRYAVLFVMSMVLILNLLYGFLYFKHLVLHSRPASKPQYPDHIFVDKGNGLVKIFVSDIAYFYKNDDDVAILLVSKELYLSANPLKYFKDILDPDLFFRVNRQFIISRDSFKSYDKLRNKGGLSLILDPPVSADIKISKKQKKAFEEWLTG